MKNNKQFFIDQKNVSTERRILNERDKVTNEKARNVIKKKGRVVFVRMESAE